MKFNTFRRGLCLALVGALLATPTAWADRVKDLATVASQRSNQLIGFGLVVGLQGTGDDASVPFTTQSMKAMLSQLGVRIDGPLSDFEQAAAASRVDIKNAAAVLVTADLPGFAKPGQRIDVNVASIGKASSLRGGSLILTALRGVDGEIYALAQGFVKWGVDHALHDGTRRNARRCGHPNGHFGASLRRVNASGRDRALGQGINFTVHPAQSGEDQAATAQAAGLANRGHVDIDALAWFGKTG